MDEASLLERRDTLRREVLALHSTAQSRFVDPRRALFADLPRCVGAAASPVRSLVRDVNRTERRALIKELRGLLRRCEAVKGAIARLCALEKAHISAMRATPRSPLESPLPLPPPPCGAAASELRDASGDRERRVELAAQHAAIRHLEEELQLLRDTEVAASEEHKSVVRALAHEAERANHDAGQLMQQHCHLSSVVARVTTTSPRAIL